MQSNRLPFFRSVADLFAGICLIALFAPWFLLGKRVFAISLTTPVYIRFLLILFIARAISSWGDEYIKRPGSYLYSHLIITLGTALSLLLLILSLIVLPLLYTTGLESTWPLHLVLALFSWLFGIYWGKNPFHNEAMQRQLIFGALSQALCLFIASRLNLLESLLEDSLPLLLFWFIGVIITTVLTHLLHTEREEKKESILTKYWPPLLAGLSLITLTIAILLSITSSYLLAILQTPARLLYGLLEYGILAIAYILGFVAQGVFYVLQWIIGEREVEFEPPPPLEPGFLFPQEEAVERVSVSGDTLWWMVLVLLLLLTIGITLYYLLRERQGRREKEEEEIRESYASLGVFKDWALLKLKELQRSIEDQRKKFSSLRSTYHSAVEIYHALLKRTEEKGEKRPESMTAHVFQKEVERVFPGHKKEAQRILWAFSKEIYRGDVVERERLLSLREDLKRIEDET